MKTPLKRRLAVGLLRAMTPRLLHDENALHRVLGEAVRLQLGRISDEEFRQRLDAYYAAFDLPRSKVDLDYDLKRARLLEPGGYKVNVLRLEGDSPAGGWRSRFTPWGRRFALLAHLGIHTDVMVLRRGATIPPHGHHRVVSGFYVFEGDVAVRHYDRVREAGDGVYVRKSIDKLCGPGDFTTNSEHHQNIHWLQGVAPVSFLFRLNVKDTPIATFGGAGRTADRVYVDPTGTPDGDGLILAPYVDAAAAKKLRIVHADTVELTDVNAAS